MVGLILNLPGGGKMKDKIKIPEYIPATVISVAIELLKNGAKEVSTELYSGLNQYEIKSLNYMLKNNSH